MGNVLTKSYSGHPPPPPRERNSHRVTVTDTDQKWFSLFLICEKKLHWGQTLKEGGGVVNVAVKSYVF